MQQSPGDYSDPPDQRLDTPSTTTASSTHVSSFRSTRDAFLPRPSIVRDPLFRSIHGKASQHSATVSLPREAVCDRKRALRSKSTFSMSCGCQNWQRGSTLSLLSPHGFSGCWTLGLFPSPIGHRERPSGRARNEIRKERKATKPPGQPSNDKSTWHRIGTRFSASCLGVFRCLWHLGSHFTYSRGYLWMLASIWLAPPRNLQGSRSELARTRQALRM